MTNSPTNSFADFMAIRLAASTAFVNGDFEPLDHISTNTSPATIFGPKGDAIQGADEVDEVNAKGAAMFEPGVVDRHSPRSRSWFAVGSLGSATAGREEEIASLLHHSGDVDVVDDIRSAKWMKLVINAAELVPSAILDLSIAEAAHYPGMKEVMAGAGYEAVDAALAAGRSVVPIFGLTTVDQSNPHGFVDTLMDILLDKYVLAHTLSTVLQDWIKTRRSEVDQINGRVVEELSRVGRKAPINDVVVQLAHRIELGELKRSTDHLPALRAALPHPG